MPKNIQHAPNVSTAIYADAWSHPLLVPGDTMEMTYRRLSEVILGGECCGSIARISEGGLCVSATHVFVENGNFLGNATAFGGCALQLIASFPYYDIIFLQGARLQCTACLLLSLVMDLA